METFLYATTPRLYLIVFYTFWSVFGFGVFVYSVPSLLLGAIGTYVLLILFVVPIAYFSMKNLIQIENIIITTERIIFNYPFLKKQVSFNLDEVNHLYHNFHPIYNVSSSGPGIYENKRTTIYNRYTTTIELNNGETWQTDTVMVQDFRNLLFYFTQLKNHHDFLPDKKMTYEEYREDNLDGLYFVKAWYVVICLSLSVYIYYLTL